jgi:hypothetical protein
VSVPEVAEAKLADRMEFVARRSVGGEVLLRGVLREGDVPVEARVAKTSRSRRPMLRSWSGAVEA